MKRETAAWLVSAEQDASAARLLTDSGFYRQAVFFTHLWMEKVLKALIEERVGLAAGLYTHRLTYLASFAAEDPPDWLVGYLGTLSPESSLARYTRPPEDAVYTADLANFLLAQGTEATEWLRQQLT